MSDDAALDDLKPAGSNDLYRMSIHKLESHMTANQRDFITRLDPPEWIDGALVHKSAACGMGRSLE